MKLREIDWETFHALDAEAKGAYLMRESRPEHVLYAQQFGRAELEYIGDLATTIRRISKSRDGRLYLGRLLEDRRAMLYFSQPSSRTFLSFTAACEILGLAIGEVRDTATSSEIKGESREDSVRTFSSYFDLIVMRTKQKGLAERMAWVLSNSERPVPIINAGSGADQHPTQALLDVYTLQRSFEETGGIDGKHIVFCGDLARGRTVRSLVLLLRHYRDLHISFIAPDEFQIGEDILSALRESGANVSLGDRLRDVLPSADAVYMTRIQDEWDTAAGESKSISLEDYAITEEELAFLKPSCVILHPLPRRAEIAPEVDRDSRAVYWRQVRNGMWVRTALIAMLFGVDGEIQSYSGKVPHGPAPSA